MSKFKAITIGAALVLTIAGLWFVFSPRPVKLDGESYDMAIALYRICNQQNEEDLSDFSKRLASLEMDAEQQAAIDQIVKKAAASQWRSAMIDCSELLRGQYGSNLSAQVR